MISITAKHEFHMAHRLVGHPGKCLFLHGHSYVLQVELCHKENNQLNESGMVMDFSIVKKKLFDWIETYWDHKLMLWDEDPLIMAGLGQLLAHKLHDTHGLIFADFMVLVPFNPTAENMVNYLHHEIFPKVLSGSPDITVKSVTIWETSKNFATSE